MPVRRRNSSSSPSADQRSTMSSVCLESHITALCTGRPVLRSQIRQVSRWLVMPTAAMSDAAMPASATAPCIVPRTDSHSATGSSSTHSRCTNVGCTGALRSATERPSASKITARVLLDPSSIART